MSQLRLRGITNGIDKMRKCLQGLTHGRDRCAKRIGALEFARLQAKGEGLTMYNIVRMYKDAEIKRRIVARGLSLEEAQAHCNNPETSSSTAMGKIAKARTRRLGAWFDGYEQAR